MVCKKCKKSYNTSKSDASGKYDYCSKKCENNRSSSSSRCDDDDDD